MKKKIWVILAAVLVLALLCGCSSAVQPGMSIIKDLTDSIQEDDRSDAGLQPFDQMEYVRPFTAALKSYQVAVELSLENGESLRTVTGFLDKCYEQYYNYYTMYNLANIRACQDTTDTYYAAEYSWCDENFTLVQQIMEELFHACARSDMADRLEDEYFWEGFSGTYADDAESYYSGDIVALFRSESTLLSQYRSLVASPTIMGDGAEVDYNSYMADIYDEDEYSDALLQYYNKYNGELAQIYIELVKVREELAEALGFENYEQMQYYYYFERDYSPEDAAGYIADIREYMVPFYREVMASDPYSAVNYTYLSDTRLHHIVGTAAENMGGQADEAFSFMSDYKLYDIELSSSKAAMSFQTYLTNYEAPFLFLDPYGDMEDILSLSHEFGHYLDAYVNYDAYETVDVSECFSQGMEYLMLSYYGDSLSGSELSNLYRMKMLDTLELYVQQASFAEFESIVYSMDPDELSAEVLNDLSLQLAKDYGYYDGINEDYYAMSWTDIVHFYEMPFYVVSYPISNDIAMQIYELEQQQAGAGLEKYLEMLPRDYDSFMDTVAAGGLESPFSEGRIQTVVQDMRARLTWSAAA